MRLIHLIVFSFCCTCIYCTVTMVYYISDKIVKEDVSYYEGSGIRFLAMFFEIFFTSGLVLLIFRNKKFRNKTEESIYIIIAYFLIGMVMVGLMHFIVINLSTDKYARMFYDDSFSQMMRYVSGSFSTKVFESSMFVLAYTVWTRKE